MRARRRLGLTLQSLSSDASSLTAAALILLYACCVVVGTAIGAVGIGGVLLVPALSLIGDIPIDEAIAIAMWCFLFTGLTGIAAYGRRGHIDWSAAFWMCSTAAPGAFAGALFVRSVAETWLLLVIVAVLLAVAIAITRRSLEVPASPQRRLARANVLVIGAISGFGSSATGTGGPLILLPLLLWRGAPVLEAVGLSQASQISIALGASAGHLSQPEPDLLQATTLATTLCVGVLLGAWLAPWLSAARLRKAVAIAAVVSAIAILMRIADTVI